MKKGEIEAIKAFVGTLVDNEECMAENAAMAVTCDMFGIDIEDGYQLLMMADDLNLFEDAA